MEPNDIMQLLFYQAALLEVLVHKSFRPVLIEKATVALT
jgi:hypothetical protein